jgi:hypothetical protein
MTLALWTAAARAFRRTALPLAAYYAITLALPLANGAARSGAAFIEHALVVLVVPPAIIVLACAFHTVKRSCCNRIDRRHLDRGPNPKNQFGGL